MKEIIDLKEKINQEIDKQDYEKADVLIDKLCKMQGLDGDAEMPKTFIVDIRRKGKVKKAMNIKKNMVKAAVVILALGISGGTVFAATQHFRSVWQFDYGLATGGLETSIEKKVDMSNIIVEDTNIASEDVEQGDEYDGKLKDFYKETLIYSENGSNDAAWAKKEVYKVTDRNYESDDGESWKVGKLEEGTLTRYIYKDYVAACKENGFINLFTKTYGQAEDVIYSEYQYEEVETEHHVIESNFQYKGGKFKVEESMEQDNGIEERNMVVITGEKVTNQREYVSENGYTFQLSDDTSLGEVRTTTLLSFDEYDVVISFTNLTDEEIHEVLDTISIEK